LPFPKAFSSLLQFVNDLIIFLFSAFCYSGMKEIIIRKAATRDLPTLLEFEQGIIATERPFDAL